MLCAAGMQEQENGLAEDTASPTTLSVQSSLESSERQRQWPAPIKLGAVSEIHLLSSTS